MADSEDRLEGVPEMPEGKIPIQAPPNQAEAAASVTCLRWWSR